MVAQRNVTRPTREQILFGLRECLREVGHPCADFKDSTLYAPGIADHLLKFRDYRLAEDLDLLFNFIEPIEEYFGFPRSNDPWQELFGFAGNSSAISIVDLTYGDIADFIARQLPSVSFEAAVIFGKSCRPAGAFLGMEEIVRNIAPEMEKFAPSTPIRSRLNGLSLRRYCQALHWQTAGAVPIPCNPLMIKSGWRQVSDISAFLIGVASYFVYFLMTFPLIPKNSEWAGWIIGISMIAFFLWVTFVYFAGHILVLRFSNPLPPGIKTFRDLAKLIACRMEANSNAVSPATQVAR